MKLYPLAAALLWGCAALVLGGKPAAAALPGDYFRLLASELERVEPADDLAFSPSYLLAAAVLYTKDHPANPARGDEKLLARALAFGDTAALQSERDESQNRQDYEWEIHLWLDGYRLNCQNRPYWRNPIRWRTR